MPYVVITSYHSSYSIQPDCYSKRIFHSGLRGRPNIHIQPSIHSNLCNEYFKTLMYIGHLNFQPEPLFCPYNLRDPFVARTGNAGTAACFILNSQSQMLLGFPLTTPVSSLPDKVNRGQPSSVKKQTSEYFSSIPLFCSFPLYVRSLSLGVLDIL